jgi:hypothetical protein
MSETEVIDAGGAPSLSADEEAFFSSGGEKSIPAEGGAAPAARHGEAKPAGEAKPGDAPKNDHVPLATFLEEKKARKELSGKLTEYEKQIAEFKGKFAIIDRLKLQGETEPAAPAGPPNPEEDIFGAVKHVGETVAQMQKAERRRKGGAGSIRKTGQGEQKVFVDKYRKACADFEADQRPISKRPTTSCSTRARLN